MCAIIGQVGGIIEKDRFILARDLMKNRGPNDCGVFFDGKNSVALGHRRLSIIDLSSSGHQPMFSKDGRYVITYNGEIFNFIELKKELKDYKFISGSDTEVLLAAYLEWGKDFLNKLNGQFAFAIYDIQKNSLFCARDHFGIKPFFYSIKEGSFLFASEIKALLALGIKSEPDEKNIFEYLNYGFYDHNENTFFKNIKRLGPGEYCIWQDSKLEKKSYWRLDQKKENEGKYNSITNEEAEEKFKSLLIDSIKLQFRSDVPVGLTLSSGVDSLGLLYFSESNFGKNLHLFSSGLADDKFDETRILDEILLPHQRANLAKTFLTSDKVWKLADKLLEIQDEPYGGFSTIHYFNLYQETKIAGVTVLLEGQGMDEILAGYDSYKNLKNNSGNFTQDMTDEKGPDILDNDFKNRFINTNVIFDKPFRSELLNAQYRDIYYTKLQRVLRFNDHISLAFGKELRLPYLDYHLVDFCFFLPDRLKISGNKQKVLLRNIAEDFNFLEKPNEQKFFFGSFQTEWMRDKFQKEIYEILNSESFKKRGYWDYEKVKNETRNLFSNKNKKSSFFLWQCINLEMWFRKFIDK